MKSFRFHKATLLLSIGLMLLFTGVLYGAEKGEDAGRSLLAVKTSIVQEPIFNGTAFISESGIGNRTSILLVHGIGEDLCARAWDSLIPELAPSYHVVSFDLPGFCRSSKQDTLYSPERYADFVKWLAARYAKGEYIVIGHSMGGAISLRFAAKYPADLKKLIIVDAAGILHRAAFTKHALQVNPSPGFLGLAELGSKLANAVSGVAVDRMEYLGSPLDLNGLVTNDLLRKALLGGDPVKISAIALMHDNFSQVIESIKAPTLIIWGTDDGVAPVRTGKLLQAKIPGSRLVLIEKGGHTPMLAQPARFNRIVLDELAGRGPAPQKESVPPDLREPLNGTCNRQWDMNFTGRYNRIDITDCQRVRLTDVSAKAINITNSNEIIIENSRIDGESVGIRALSSEVVMTNVSVKADIAITGANSYLDLAGVNLQGKQAAATTTGATSLLFSVSKVQSPGYTDFMHGLYNLTPEKPL